MSAQDEFTTMQAALAFGGFTDAAETERVTLWAAEEIERLRAENEALKANPFYRSCVCVALRAENERLNAALTSVTRALAISKDRTS